MAKKSKSSKKLNHKNVLYVVGAVIVIVLLLTVVLKYSGKQLAGKAIAISQETDVKGNKILPAVITISDKDLADIVVGGVRTAEFEFNGKTYVLTVGKLSDNSLGGKAVNVFVPDGQGTSCGNGLCDNDEDETNCLDDCVVLQPDLEVINIVYSLEDNVMDSSDSSKISEYAYKITLKNNGGSLEIPQTTNDADAFKMKTFLYKQDKNIDLYIEPVLNEKSVFSLSNGGTYEYIVYLFISDVDAVSLKPEEAHLAVIIDTNNIVDESNENNNDFWFNPFQTLQPDLEVINIVYSLEDNVMDSSDSSKISEYAYKITLKNNGGSLEIPQTTNDADAFKMKTFLYKQDKNIDLYIEPVLNEKSVFSLSNGGTYEYIVYLFISDVDAVSLKPEEAHLAVIIDTNNIVDESNENNNDFWFNPFQTT